MRLIRALSVVAAALTLTLTACGGVDLGLGDDGGTPATAAAESDRKQALLDFAKCMRQNGVDMPDPQFDGDGGVLIQGGQGGDGGEPDRQQLAAAQEACKQYMDKAEAGGRKPSAEDQQKMREAGLAFARCMREHGIDFPDPQFDGGRVTQELDRGADPNSPKFKAAEEACRKAHPGPGGGPGGKVAGGAGGSR